MSVFYILMFGNLLFLIIDQQFSVVTAQNIYIPASLLLNIILLLELRFFFISSKKYLLFFLVALIGPITSFLVLNFDDFIVVTVKYFWIISSVTLLNYLITHSPNQEQFKEIQTFAIFTGYFILANILLSIIFINDAYVANEGLQSLLISADKSKKLTLLVLPFFLLADKKNLVPGFLLLLYLMSGTRALMLSAISLFLFFVIYFLNSPSTMKNQNKMIPILLIFSVFGGIFFILLSFRTVNLTNFVSTLDRVVIWSQYFQVLQNYPLGLGPEGAYYYLSAYGFSSTLDLGFLSQFLTARGITTGAETAVNSIEQLVTKRLNVSATRNAISSESMFLDFICSFGIIGALVIGNLFFNFVKDFRYAISFVNNNFSIIYGSLGANLIYGFFNSYHTGIFFMSILYIMYFFSRDEVKKEVLV